VFGTVQKYQDQKHRDPDAEEEGEQESDDAGANGGLDSGRRDAAEPLKKPTLSEPFEVLNESEDILILVDEAHRTQAGDLHTNMMRALPNAARIGFTGTPIIMGDKKRTHDIFGEYIDRQVGDRAKASEMEHAVRSHVRKHLDEDPVKYGRLSGRLEELLQQLDGQWAEQVEALKTLIQQLRDGAQGAPLKLAAGRWPLPATRGRPG